MNKIDELKNDLKKQEAEYRELQATANKRDSTLTDEEKERIEQLRKEKHIDVVESGVGGSVSTPIAEYVKKIDEQKAILNRVDGTQSTIKLLSNNFAKTGEDVKKQATDGMIGLMRGLSNNTDDDEISDEELLGLNDLAIEALKRYFKTEKLDSDVVSLKLKNMPYSTLCSILPPKFVKLYTNDIDTSNFKGVIKAKELLLTSIAYMIVSGPEIDQLSEYIDTEEKLNTVGRRMIQMQLDMSNVINNDESISNALLAESEKTRSEDAINWSKYIRNPDMASNIFAQRAVVQRYFADGYKKLLPEYEDQDSLDIIQGEIDACLTKADIYDNIAQMDIVPSLVAILMTRHQTEKRASKKRLHKEALAAIERSKKSKVDVTFPGYTGKEKTSEDIFKSTYNMLSVAIERYNSTVLAVGNRNAQILKGQEEITTIDADAKIFTEVFIIVMGRIMKHYSKEQNAKLGAIYIDSYYQLLCRINVDIFVMNRFYRMSRDFIKLCENLK